MAKMPKFESLPEPEMASDGPGPGEYKNSPGEKVNTGSRLFYNSTPSVADALRKIGDDLRKQRPVAEGTVMRFTHVGDNGRQYYYAAIFANGRWYTTGHSGRSPFAGFHTHHNFMALLGRHDVIAFELASSWEAIL